MPLDVPASSYVLPPGVDAAALVAVLAERLDVEAGRPATLTTTVLDTVDRRVRDAGAELHLEPGRAGARLVLRRAPGEPPLEATVERARRYLVDDLPEGPLRDALAPVVEMRALLPLVRLRVEGQALAVRNADEKTVVRLTVASRAALPAPATATTPAAASAPAGRLPDGAVPLPPRVEVAGVLGYPKPRARVEDLLAGELGLTPVDRGAADEAVVALGGDPAGLRTKVAVDLAPDQRSDDAARAVLLDLAGMVEANLPGTLDDLDTEFLHDLRVAVRRSRSVLRELKGAFPPAPLAVQRDGLKWVQTVTGTTRDLDVQLLEWPDLAGKVAPDRRADLGPVHGLLAEQRAAAARALRRELRGRAFAGVWSGYRAFLDDPGPGAAKADVPIGRAAGRRIRKVYRRMLDMGGAIDGGSPPEALHDLRKRGKELRYLLELFGGLWPTDVVKPMVKSLKALQDVLGRHQDRAVQAGRLRDLAGELAGRPGGPAALLSLGAVVERLEEEQHAARAEFADRFAAFSARDRREQVSDTFRRPR